MSVRKTISVPKDQAEWVEKNHINLSRFVQSRIEEMKRKGGEVIEIEVAEKIKEEFLKLVEETGLRESEILTLFALKDIKKNNPEISKEDKKIINTLEENLRERTQLKKLVNNIIKKEAEEGE